MAWLDVGVAQVDRFGAKIVIWTSRVTPDSSNSRGVAFQSPATMVGPSRLGAQSCIFAEIGALGPAAPWLTTR